jgi:hypothetical protein
MIEKILESYNDEELLIADGFDNALIGLMTDFSEPRLIYSVSKCIKVLMERDGMTYLDAQEYFTFNVSGAYVGEKTPIWCWDDFE